ncbi:WXG100 family type VII secretion target [Nocardia asteroides]|uniref:WXG100 family type VII secretion target n=1 Tax=Nocardia asteroides TaxID=1824 RepID=UPI001E4CA68B|nr:WXG100 family type VII secretion target [Nocardia asteroides]UGT63169.1 WXG100 family type VII secretion target [Nocardia asteroides]
MADGYSVDLRDLEALTSKLTAYQEFLVQQLDELDRRVRTLSATWSGAAGIAFEEAHRDWAAGVAAVSAAVETLRRDAEEARTAYTEVGIANSKMVGRGR